GFIQLPAIGGPEPHPRPAARPPRRRRKPRWHLPRWRPGSNRLSAGNSPEPSRGRQHAHSAGPGAQKPHPVQVTASNYTAALSTRTEPTPDPQNRGGSDVGWINKTSWLEYPQVNFGSGTTSVAARMASAVSGTNLGTINFRLDSLTAAPFASITVNG